MSLWILDRIDKSQIGYDEYVSKVVRASSNAEARAIANVEVGDEGHIWDKAKMVTCKKVGIVGKSGVILTEFYAG